MNPLSSLTGANFRTYNILLQPLAPQQLTWTEIDALVRYLGDSIDGSPDQVSRNGHSMVIQPDRGTSVTGDDLAALRKFLIRSETPRPPIRAQGPDLLVLIDHAKAWVAQIELTEGVPSRLQPIEPAEKTPVAGEADAPPEAETFNPKNFFAPIARSLEGDGRILVFGGGTGMSGALDQFVTWLRAEHPALAMRIVDVLSIDTRRLSSAQLLAKVRNSYRRSHEPTA